MKAARFYVNPWRRIDPMYGVTWWSGPNWRSIMLIVGSREVVLTLNGGYRNAHMWGDREGQGG